MVFFLQRLGTKTVGSTDGEFRIVYGLLVVKDRLYVSDHRIQIFRLRTRDH